MSEKRKINLLEHFGHSINCFMRDGKLYPEYVCMSRPVNYSSGLKFAAYSKASDCYFICDNKTIGVSSDCISFTHYTGYAGAPPFLIEDYFEGIARTIIIVGRKAAVYVGGGFIDKELEPWLLCGAMHCGRLFGANGLDLWWSGPGGFDDWNEGIGGRGRLRLDPERGEVLDMVEYGGKLIAVRKYGLTILNVYGSPEEFAVKITDTDCDVIYGGTARVVGNKLYFFSESGLKTFDGSKISPLKIRHPVSKPVCSAEYGGRYFLGCKDDYLNKDVVLCVDSTDGESLVLTERATLMFIKDALYFFNESRLNMFYGGGYFVFESAPIDFGTSRPKTITKIEFAGSPVIYVDNGKCERMFEDIKYSIRPHMRGRSFTIKVESTKTFTGATVTAEVTDAV